MPQYSAPEELSFVDELPCDIEPLIDISYHAPLPIVRNC